MGAGRKICLWFLANCEVQLCSALAAISILSVIVVCPILLDPAIDILVSSFDEGICQTIYGRYLTGQKNCTWSSCRSGCTQEIFNCTQIIVVYMKGVTELELQNNFATNISSNYYHHSKIFNKGWEFPSRELDFTLVRDLNLTLILDEFLDGLDENSSSNNSSFLQIERNKLNIGALFPNPQGCVYPSESVCVDFNNTFGKMTGKIFPCYINNWNSSIVTTTLDKMGAVHNILYSFIPLILASGVFTYLFYRVGLIGNKNKSKLKVLDEELFTSDTESTTQQKPGIRVDKNGKTINGAPPGIKKKLRKKFLPKRENSSKKRRKGKLFNKNKLLSVKHQLSIKSPGSSTSRAPNISMGMSPHESFDATRHYSHRSSIQV